MQPLDASDALTDDAFAADLPSDSDGASGSDAGGPDGEEARDVDSPSAGPDSSNSQEPGLDAGGRRSTQEHFAGRQRHSRRMQLQVTKLSKFEAGCLEHAKQRHKAHIAQPKVSLVGCSVSTNPVQHQLLWSILAYWLQDFIPSGH